MSSLSSHLPSCLPFPRAWDKEAIKCLVFLYFQVKIEEPVSMEMDNHMSDKDESCYDNAEAAFSDDEEDLNSKGSPGLCPS